MQSGVSLWWCCKCIEFMCTSIYNNPKPQLEEWSLSIMSALTTRLAPSPENGTAGFTGVRRFRQRSPRACYGELKIIRVIWALKIMQGVSDQTLALPNTSSMLAAAMCLPLSNGEFLAGVTCQLKSSLLSPRFKVNKFLNGTGSGRTRAETARTGTSKLEQWCRRFV
jgi:hypothetical protein